MESEALSGIPGLLYCKDFLTPEEHDAIVGVIDANPFRRDIHRR